MKIESITVVKHQHAMDTIILHTDLPGGVWPYKPKEGSLLMHATLGEGENYCKTHFPGIPVKVVP